MLEKSGFIRPHVSLAVYVFFFLVGLGFELSASHLQSRWSTTWATALVHFALVIFEDGVSWTICLGQPQTKILLISASQVASITSMSHWCPPSLIDWWSFWDRLLLFLRTDVSFAVIYLFIYFETESCYVAQAGLETHDSSVFLPQPPRCWDYRPVLLCWVVIAFYLFRH
jgi:hypothetical protein